MAARSVTLSSLSYIHPTDLSSQLLNPTTASKVAVVDVRDNDYVGGHVKDSIHAPIDQLDARMPELLRTLKDKDKVVFHCMLSQQRGPKAALAYARAKANEVAKQGEDKGEQAKNDDERTRKFGGQEICVLEGGFGQWQSRYGDDKKLTEGYVKELWESVFG